jgi:hypothetical protein
MTDNSKSPLYSLVTFGRNDNYNPDFLYRLQTMLNFNARALEKIGRLDDVEFVVVDWGSEVPLREALALEAPAAAASSFLELSPEAVARVSDVPNGMHSTRAVNTGIRRALGQFVGFQGADLLTTNTSWRALLWALEDSQNDFPALSKSILQVPRRIVPWSFVGRQPDLDRWERWLLTCSHANTIQPRSSFPAVGGGMGIIILHRELWHEAKALEETFSGWGYNDIDLVCRVSAYHPWIDAEKYGVTCYKMEHAPHGQRGRLFKGGGSPVAVNPHWFTTSLASRFVDWGLPDLVLEAKKANPRVERGDVNSEKLARDRWPENVRGSAEQYFDKEVDLHVSAVHCGALNIESDLEMLQILSWFALRKFPVTYLEIGLRHNYYVRAIAAGCPSVDIYVLESEEKNRDGVLLKAVSAYLHLLWEWGHKGYFRASAGNLLANFERLKQSFIGPFELEAVTLQLEEPNDVKLLLPALQSVVDGGLLAMHAARKELLEAALKAYESLPTDAHVMLGHSGRTAFLFVHKEKHRDPERKISAEARSSLLRIPMPTKLDLRAAKLRRRFRKLFRGKKISK